MTGGRGIRVLKSCRAGRGRGSDYCFSFNFASFADLRDFVMHRCENAGAVRRRLDLGTGCYSELELSAHILLDGPTIREVCGSDVLDR